jgi:hypothetical protein
MKNILLKYYCENCGKENLSARYVDRMGAVFCSKQCYLDSKEYRDIKISKKDKLMKVTG